MSQPVAPPPPPRPAWRPPDSLLAALMLCAIMLLAGAAIYSAALGLQLAAQATLDREAARLRAARQDLRQLPDRMALARSARDDFERMAERRFVSAGERLDWVSSLARIGRLPTREGGSLGNLTWQLEPRQAHDALSGLWITPMLVRASPPGPDGLAEVLGRLAAEAKGQFSVESCSLTLENTASGQAGPMECRLLWWNWQDPEAAESMPGSAP